LKIIKALTLTLSSDAFKWIEQFSTVTKDLSVWEQNIISEVICGSKSALERHAQALVKLLSSEGKLGHLLNMNRIDQRKVQFENIRQVVSNYTDALLKKFSRPTKKESQPKNKSLSFESAKNGALSAYNEAVKIASSELPPTHPMRLGLALNVSTFYNDIMQDPETAKKVAKESVSKLKSNTLYTTSLMMR
jgi:hypothetical protein